LSSASTNWTYSPFAARRAWFRGGDPGVGLVDDLEPGVGGLELLADGQTAVGAAVVDQQHLQVGIALPPDALQAGVQPRSSVIDRDDHGYQGLFHKAFLLFRDI